MDAVCTSLSDLQASEGDTAGKWTSSTAWASEALLPTLQLLGTDYTSDRLLKRVLSDNRSFDVNDRIELLYPDAVAQAAFGKAVKSEGLLVVSVTDGYIYARYSFENEVSLSSKIEYTIPRK